MVLNHFLTNQIDSTGKIKFTMQIQDEEGIEFLDIKLKLENSKIVVDVFSKPTNSFTYVLPSCHPRKSINNIPRGIALRLRHICDTDVTTFLLYIYIYIYIYIYVYIYIYIYIYKPERNSAVMSSNTTQANFL